MQGLSCELLRLDIDMVHTHTQRGLGVQSEIRGEVLTLIQSNLGRRVQFGDTRVESRWKRHIEFRWLGQRRTAGAIYRLKKATEPGRGRNHQVITARLQMSQAITAAIVRNRLLGKRGLP